MNRTQHRTAIKVKYLELNYIVNAQLPIFILPQEVPVMVFQKFES